MKNDKLFKIALFTALIMVAFGVRLFKIDNSITEWFSWRQSDTAAVGKIYAKEGVNLLRPRYYDLSNIQSGKDNPQGLRFVEFPIYNAAFGTLAHYFSFFSVEMWARLVTAICSLIVLAVLFYILSNEFGLMEAFFGGLFFSIFPYVVFYSRAILPDMPAVSLAMVSIFFMYRAMQKGWIAITISAVFFALALLVKPTVGFYALIPVYLLYRKFSKENLFHVVYSVGLFTLVSLVPFALWRWYISGFPEGIPASQWLFTSVNTSQGLKNIFFRPAFFRWIFFERISQLILGSYMIFFVIMSFFVSGKSKLKLHYVFLVSGLLYLFTFQGGNVQHDYYQIIITPVLAILAGTGIGWFLKQRRWGLLAVRFVIVVAIMSMSLFFSFNQVIGNYTDNKDLVLIADIVDTYTNKNDVIVTDSQGDTTLLYLSDRRGYPAPYKSFDELKKQGASFFVTQDLNYKKTMDKKYKLLFENDKVLLFVL